MKKKIVIVCDINCSINELLNDIGFYVGRNSIDDEDGSEIWTMIKKDFKKLMKEKSPQIKIKTLHRDKNMEKIEYV